jgi:hypothetical protein
LFLSVISIGIISLFILNYVRFGNIFNFGYGGEGKRFYLVGIKRHIIPLLFSLQKGIFIYNPILLLSFLGYFTFIKFFKKEALLFLAIIIVNLCVTAMWHSWWGGLCWGPRFLVPTIPLWLFPLIFFPKDKKFLRYIVMFFILVSFLIQLISVVQREHEYYHIKENLVEAGLRSKMPADIIGSIVILKHKLVKRDNTYSVSEFGIDSDSIVDTYEWETYRGPNLWYYHLAVFYDKPIIKYLPFPFLPFIGIYLIFLLKMAKKLDKQEASIAL